MKSHQGDKSHPDLFSWIATNIQSNKGLALPAVPPVQTKPIVQKLSDQKEEEEDGRVKAAVQLKTLEEEDLPIQRVPTTQRKEATVDKESPGPGKFIPNTKKENKTGLPDQLKEGMENLSGMAMDDVKVHYNSDKPAQLNALAYAQGTAIHVAPGQERHLPHEAWHIVQQKQRRVQPTMQMKEGVAINDDTVLENEADTMGAKALHVVTTDSSFQEPLSTTSIDGMDVAQLLLVKVKTKKLGNGNRVIIALEIAERAPTTVSGSQGDHTVAEALMELTIVNFVVGKTHNQVANTILALLAHLDEQAKARFKNDADKFVTADIAYIMQLIAQYQFMLTNEDVEGEDLNTQLETILDIFIRVWNKRAGSAYLRSEGKTTGGGGGAGEKEAKKKLKEAGERSNEQESGSEQLAMDMAQHINTMVDFVVGNQPDLVEAAKHISAALELILTAYPFMEHNYYDLMVFAINAFVAKAKLNKKQEELLFELIHGRVTPYENEDYMDFEEDEVKTTSKAEKLSTFGSDVPRFFINNWDGRSLPDEVFRYFILTSQVRFIINNSMVIRITKFNEENNNISYSIGPLGG